MPRPKRVLCIMDICGIGRSSLATVLPVLAACGVQGCPLPTELLSTHTGGFGAPLRHDTTAFAAEALRHYTPQQIAFDAIYTGYLASDAQFNVAEAAMAQWPNALKVADPAMGDGGKLYEGMAPQTSQRMLQLCQSANLITPNYTETALLAGEEPTLQPLPRQQMANRMAQLAGQSRQVLATSVPTPEHTMEIWGCGPEGQEMYAITAYHAPQNYPGTGDAFTAAVVGLLLRGLPLRAAAVAAADFVRAAALTTLAEEGDARHGIWYETQLAALTLAANSYQ